MSSSDNNASDNKPSAPARRRHIVLTTHNQGKPAPDLDWGAEGSQARGPVVVSTDPETKGNVIGAHSGSYAVYRAVAMAAGHLDPLHRPDLTNTSPAEPIGPFPQWGDPKKIVSLDPYGHVVGDVFKSQLDEGWDIRPTIAVTKAHMTLHEIHDAIRKGRLTPDGEILKENGDIRVTKVAIEPVWYLPGVAERFGIDEITLRRALFEHTGGMYPELVTRGDLKVFLPPIGGITIYMMGDPAGISDPDKRLACRVHDECNGSDVFGSDICTCRPYLTHGIEMCVEEAQKGGNGVIVYNRKEGRALGEVTKFLVYNARKRQEGGDRADTYFERTECVAGVQDMRFQELMPDPLHWLGITRIDRFASMSDMKYDALTGSGIEIGERVPIPEDLIPDDAKVEMDAKRAAGYFTDRVPTEEELAKAAGRTLDD